MWPLSFRACYLVSTQPLQDIGAELRGGIEREEKSNRGDGRKGGRQEPGHVFEFSSQC